MSIPGFDNGSLVMNFDEAVGSVSVVVNLGGLLILAKVAWMLRGVVSRVENLEEKHEINGKRIERVENDIHALTKLITPIIYTYELITDNMKSSLDEMKEEFGHMRKEIQSSLIKVTELAMRQKKQDD